MDTNHIQSFLRTRTSHIVKTVHVRDMAILVFSQVIGVQVTPKQLKIDGTRIIIETTPLIGQEIKLKTGALKKALLSHPDTAHITDITCSISL